MRSSRDSGSIQFIVWSSPVMLFPTAAFRGSHYAISVQILEIGKETSGDRLPLRTGHGCCTQLSLPSYPIDKNFVTISMRDWEVNFFFWLAMCSLQVWTPNMQEEKNRFWKTMLFSIPLPNSLDYTEVKRKKNWRIKEDINISW